MGFFLKNISIVNKYTDVINAGNSMKKTLSLQEAVQAGRIVYSMNSERGASIAFARQFGLLDINIDFTNFPKNSLRNKFLKERTTDTFQNDSNSTSSNTLINTKKSFSHNCCTSLLVSELEELFLWEWRAFVHAAVLYALSEKAPAVVFVEYLKEVQGLLKSQCEFFNEEWGQCFIDEPFQAYMAAVLEKRIQDCPQIFLQRYLNLDVKDTQHIDDKISNKDVAALSGTMAMLFAATMDAFEKYDYALS